MRSEKYRDDNFLWTYLNSIKNNHILSNEEEKELFIRVQNNDLKAKEKLIESNLALVASIARKYCNCGMEVMDLIQEGNMALVKAIEEFQLSENCRFSTFAYKVIERRIINAIYKKSKLISLTSGFYREMIKFNAAKKKLEKKVDRLLTYNELAIFFNIPYEKVFIYLNYLNEPIHFSDDSISDESLLIQEESVLDNLILEDLKSKIQELLVKSHIKERDLDILKSRIGFDGNITSLDELSKKYNLSIEGVRQIYFKALERLRMNKDIDEFKVYVTDDLSRGRNK